MKQNIAKFLLILVALVCSPGGAAATTYTYDVLNRLTTVSYTGGGGLTYTYDAAGNLLSLVSTSSVVSNYTLTVNLSGAGSGRVSGSGIDCGSTCSASYASGASVTLTATPATGSTLAGWSGACSGTGSCTVSMSQAQSVTATFNMTSTLPGVTLSPSSLTFTAQNLTTTSAAQAITLSNTGSGTLNITSIAASGDYARTTTCGATLAAGANCSISVTFTPTANGARTGAITITSNATGSPHSVSLSGVGTPSSNFPGNRSNYSITKTSTGFSVTDKLGAGGAVALTGATQIKFADMTVNLLIGDLSKTIPADSLKTLIELYVAFFNRIPDSDGLAYWIGQFNSGMSLDQIAESFYTAGIQYSSLTGFSAGMTPDDFINTVYRNVLGRPDGADQGGMDYWKPKLLDGSATHGSLVTDILFAAHSYKADPTWHWVPDLLDNKYSVATFFCLQQGLNYNTPEIAIAEGMAIAAAVTPTSTAAAIALIMVNDSGFDLTLP